jgi:hypothetical protein
VNALEKVGISPEAVRRLTVAPIPKNSCGRRGLPPYAVNAIYADYLRLKSTRKVGEIYGRTGQSIWDLLHGHGLPMERPIRKEQIIFDGRGYTFSKGYYRHTNSHQPLHHAIWIKANGPVPDGHMVSFKDGDSGNLTLKNLFTGTKKEVTLYHYRRLYPNRAEFTPEQRRSMWRTHNRLYMRRKSARNKQRGLRCDGKPFARNKKKICHGGNAAWRALGD